jgi:hypothetical protein
MPIDGFNVPDTLVISLSAVPFDGCLDTLPCLFRIGIEVKASFFLSQSPVETFYSAYGLRMTKAGPSMMKRALFQAGDIARSLLISTIGRWSTMVRPICRPWEQ